MMVALFVGADDFVARPTSDYVQGFSAGFGSEARNSSFYGHNRLPFNQQSHEIRSLWWI
jgi:hypothetical protein